jgi:DNA-binding transcriptional ArsR family regulator
VEAAVRAIAEPRRRAILRLVWDAELTAGEIASHFEVTRPAISQHLTVLKGAGLLRQRRQGTRRLYTVDRAGLAELRAFLDQLWGDSLERLKHEAELEEQRSVDRGVS